MISLEGLTLATGPPRARRATSCARSPATCRDGLIPNLFPEGENEGLYHTADATLWFFHALDRYERQTGDVETLPAAAADAGRHRRPAHRRHALRHRRGSGRRPAARRAPPGYQLTWMDAKVGDWVVTPRRGQGRWRSTRSGTTRCGCSRAGCGAEAQAAPRPDDVNADAIARRADAVHGVQRALLVRRRRVPLRRRRRRGGRRRRELPAQPDAGDLAAASGAGRRRAGQPCCGGRATGWRRRSACARSRPGIPTTSRATTAICARATPPITRARCGAGWSARSSTRGCASSRPIAPARAAADRGPGARAARSVHRHDQRDLRRRAAVHPARLRRPGLERRRGAARHSPHRPALRLITASGPIAPFACSDRLRA